MTAPFEFVQAAGGISQFRHAGNGLTVLVRPDAAYPSATAMVTYAVGSRDELPGTTGATHLLEHMMFKGSAAFPPAANNGITSYLERVGGEYNATTWLDRTNYYATVAPAHLDGYLAIEADRMRHLLLEEESLRREITVVLDELERGDTPPEGRLGKEVKAAAFISHPYRHPTIGWRSDVERATAASLRSFYDTFYWPDNATLSFIGCIGIEEALALAERHFGGFTRAPRPRPAAPAPEPPQHCERRVVLRAAGQLAIVHVVHKAVEACHPDYPALWVLGCLLSRGGNSRLQQALVDGGLAMKVSAGPGFHRDPHLFEARLTCVAGVAPEKAEAALLGEYRRIQEEIPPADELQRAKTQLRTAEIWRRDKASDVASVLNECIAAGDWRLYHRLLEAMELVSAEEVQRVARSYLTLERSTSGWFIPVGALR